MTATPMLGDCLDVMAALAADGVQVQAIVTDPPYGLEFMGRAWDGAVPGVAYWKAALDLLPPGGHLLAFGGSRTFHRMAVAIEDAGFEIRDTIMWLYGSGFPKTADVAKLVDKSLGVQGTFGEPKSAAHAGWIERGAMRGTEGEEGWQRPWMEDPDAVSNAARQYIPGSAEAAEWVGWGTALKPAFEPIIVARKPFKGTIAANVLAHRVGALNIDASRVGDFVNTTPSGQNRYNANNAAQGYRPGAYQKEPAPLSGTPGRWPANVMHDGSDSVLEAFASYGQRGAAAPVRGTEPSAASNGDVTGARAQVPGAFHADTGTAARFFYCAKATKADRAGSKHPTVKPLALMRYLCTLVTPPGGTVLDPFAGSGSTLQAALESGFNAIGIERDEQSFLDIVKRLKGMPDAT